MHTYLGGGRVPSEHLRDDAPHIPRRRPVRDHWEAVHAHYSGNLFLRPRLHVGTTHHRDKECEYSRHVLCMDKCMPQRERGHRLLLPSRAPHRAQTMQPKGATLRPPRLVVLQPR